jgi:hypothetical protein
VEPLVTIRRGGAVYVVTTEVGEVRLALVKVNQLVREMIQNETKEPSA